MLKYFLAITLVLWAAPKVVKSIRLDARALLAAKTAQVVDDNYFHTKSIKQALEDSQQ